MLTPPPFFLSVVARKAWPKATNDDVAMIRGLVELRVPDSYVDLVTRFGCVSFNEPGDLRAFGYRYSEPGFEQAFEGSISHFLKPEKVRSYAEAMQDPEVEGMPKYPAFMLPIGLDFEENIVLLECGGESDRIWFWEYQDEAWGEGDNVRLGLVASSLQAFLDGLHAAAD